MQLTTPRDHLIKLNENLIYHFFLCNNKSLHYNIYNINNILLSNNELISDIINFSVTVDKNENIHLICITSKGELQYHISKNNNWNCKTISEFDVKSNIYKYLTLHISNKYTHLLYIKTNWLTRDLSSIEHMYWGENDIDKIIVTNYIHDKYTSPLQVSSDISGNIHMVYRVFYKDNYQLYYNRFNVSTKIWSASELITDLQKEHSHPYIFIDKEQNLHLVWCTIEQGNFILKYKKKHDVVNMKSKWSDTQTLSNRDSNCISPVLIQESNNLKIYCRQSDKIIEIVSKDFGDSWTNLTNSRSYIIREPKIIRYSAKSQTDDKYTAKHVYGNIKDRIRIIGINLFNEKTQDKLQSAQTTPKRKEQPVSEQGQQPAPRQKNNCAIYETEQNNTDITDSDKLDDTADMDIESNNIMNELLSIHNTLEEQLSKLKEKKQRLTKSIKGCESELNLLEEKIINYKKQMLTFQVRLNNIASNKNVFQRFISFFK